jgi:nucleoside-diphosphate-sugar epimerase
MKVIITGASGYIGSSLAHALATQGHQIHALVRSCKKQDGVLHPNITEFNGDLLNKESLIKAMKGCDQLYHVAAKVGAWSRQASDFHDANVEGTRNVLEVARQTGIEKTVYTSSCGVIGPSGGEPRSESDPLPFSYQIDYDVTKRHAEDVAMGYARQGMNLVIVSPAKVFGPGHTSHSLTANAIINNFLKKRLVVIPWPGTNKVCMAYATDVINGHISAMANGRAGERYILGGPNVSYREFFETIRSISNCNGVILQLPKKLAMAWARYQELNYKLFQIPMRFTAKSVNHVFSNYIFSSEKATRELGYTITPLAEALRRTIDHLNK